MGFNVRVTALLVLMAATLSGYAQERILGTWKTFMPFGTSLAVCDAGDKIYSAAAKSVFSYEKATGVIQIYDKSNALSDVDIKTISYDPATKCLAIAYNNANIDLIFNGTDVYNISDIKAENTSGSVGINSIYFYNGDCYLSTDIGIAVINLERKEISNTYVIGSSGAQIKVYATSINGNNIYAATQEGVKHASLNSSNLLNFSSWSLYSEADSLPTRKATYVASLGNYMYAVISNDVTDTLYQYNGTYWSPVYSNTSEVFSSLNTSANGNIYFTTINNVNYSTSKQGQVNQSGTVSVFAPQGHIRPAGWFDDNGTHWEADLWNGLFINTNGNIENIKPDGPFSADDYGLTVSNGVLYIAGGGVDDSWGFTYNRSGVSIYKNNTWIYKNEYVDPQLMDVTDLLSVASVPASGKTYFGSFYAGLVEYNNDNNSINTIYDKHNSILEGAQGDDLRTKISCLYADINNNLWIGNAGAPSLIKEITNTGEWKEFTIPYTISLLKKIIVDRNNQIWAPTRQTNGLLVFSYGNDIDNPADDSYKLLRTGAGAGNLPDENVYCVAEDKDGNIWVGTNQGIAVYYCASSILTQYGCDADLIKVERDGYIGYLFSTESVRAITVDAANRKWIGTTNGLWLISADGKTELLKFTVDNSPLPSNQITDITIDDNTGEVFIGTIGGLISYQGDAMSECTDCDKALVYPNPVGPEYTGPIAIKGLTEGAYVKITDVTGTLIYQGKANGSQMIWDGKGYNGTRAKSGVYLVFSSTDTGKEKRVAKILLAN